MPSGFPGQVELLGAFVRAGGQARGELTAAECDLMLDICTQVIAMAPTLPGAEPGRAARYGTQILLDHTVPGVAPALRDALAQAVERIVMRHAHTT